MITSSHNLEAAVIKPPEVFDRALIYRNSPPR